MIILWAVGFLSKSDNTMDFLRDRDRDGELSSALGTRSKGRHRKFGVVDPKSDFAVVKKRLLDIIAT